MNVRERQAVDIFCNSAKMFENAFFKSKTFSCTAKFLTTETNQ